ncbi:DUF4348 domain-containing protein, partial [Bacteroides sp. OttesenSCG-928-D19]|nr:DUF4348 domain-containing protein [Bacteroides sp. OttesenSCG-928-D19]
TTSIQLEWVYMETLKAVRYYFERINGRWMLEAVNQHTVNDEKKDRFIDFFVHFSTDSVFQLRHISDPLQFVTTDPDDDFAILESVLDPNQWLAFKPELSQEKLSNISYGQKNEDTSPTKIVQVKGIGNGFLNTLFFRKKHGKWILYKFEDTSN